MSEPILAGDLEKLIELHNERDDLRAKLAIVDAERKVLESSLVEKFAMLGVSSMNVGDRTIFRRVDRYVSVKADRRAEAIDAARQCGLEEMIVLQPARFKSWALEQLDDEQALPDVFAELVNMHEKVQIRVRK